MFIKLIPIGSLLKPAQVVHELKVLIEAMNVRA